MIRSEFRVSLALVIITLAVRTSWSQTPVVDHGTGQAAAEGFLQRGSEKWQQLLDELKQHSQETKRLRGEGQIAEAIAACEKMLALERKLSQALAGEKTPEAAAQRSKFEDDVAGSLSQLGQMHLQKENFPAARQSWQEALSIWTRLQGTQHWSVTDARLALEDVQLWEKLTAEQRQRLLQAEQWHREGMKELSKGQLKQVEDLEYRVLNARREILGPDHPEVAATCEMLALILSKSSDLSGAEDFCREAIRIRETRMGKTHPKARRAMEHLAAALDKLGSRLVEQEDWGGAITRRNEVVQLRTLLLGEQHWQVTDARLAVEDAVLRSKLTAEDRERLREADVKVQSANALYQKGQFAAAVELAQQGLEVRRRFLGENHPHYAEDLNSLGRLHESLGDFAQAEPLYRQSHEFRKAVLGEKHPDCAMSLNNLATLYLLRRDFSQAESLFRQALDITKAMLGEKHMNYAASLSGLGRLYLSQGEYAQAESLFRQTLDITKAVLGEKHMNYAASLNNLAKLYQSQGEYAQAEPLCRQTLDITKAVQGEKHPDYATSLNNLAQLYMLQGDHAQAEPLLRQARDIRKAVVGEKHPDYAASLSDLATLYMSQQNYAQAEPLIEQARDIHSVVFGKKHPNYALSLDHLAKLYDAAGNYAQAELLYRQACEIRRAVQGEKHNEYATSLSILASFYVSQVDYAQAEPLQRQALDIAKTVLGEKHPGYATSLTNLGASLIFRLDTDGALPLARLAATIQREHVEATAAVQSDRQQFLMSDKNRSGLDLLLMCDVTLGTALADDYGEVLHVKGRIWQRQLATRAVADRPELAKLFDELRSVSARRAKLTLDVPDLKKQEVWRRQVNELAERQEVLERDLSEQSAAFRAARRRVTLEDLRKQLPAGTAVVDCFEYSHFTPAPGERGGMKDERRLVAFVIRADAEEVRIVPLGPVKPLSQAIDKWRISYGQSPSAQEAGQLLRHTIWEPLVPHLKDAKLVLFSPDGVLGRFPLAALSGKQPGSYLLEEVPLVVIPCVMALPQMLAPDSQAPRPEPNGNLLVLGDIDYDASSETPMTDGSAAKKFGRKQSAVRSSEWKGFTPLPGTNGELASIEKLYREIFGRDGITVLEKGQAREELFREEAVKHKYLHVATHGFFAPPSLKSMLQQSADQERFSLPQSDNGPRFLGHPPGLLSGLAFAGANKTPELDKEDGILTASEVENLDLRGVQLAVLSACETGLGEVAGGEGLLGLQRAFQVAGAQTVVASLWQVSDNATRALMERFYDNLLKKEMGTLESLREAQLWMLKEGPSRGLVLKENSEANNSAKRSPPFYWAAFVLSGDWR